MRISDWSSDVCSSDLRLTAETGPVLRRSAAQLGAVVLSGSSETIPTLRQVLGLIAGRVPVLIEIKSRRSQRVAALRSEERRVGQECVSTCRSRWPQYT